MEADHRRLDRVRQRCTEVENHVIDEFVGGRLTRRDFLRRGALVGVSLPALGAVLAACGSAGAASTSAGGGARGKPGATIRAGILVPTGAIDPVTVADQGGHVMLSQTGEYLCLADQRLMLRPVLATNWKPNADASAWTFTIRQGVKFSNGSPMTVDDVVYTFKSQCDPKSSANALSAFGGVLLPDGVVKTSDTTVTFNLESPNGNFPYLCSTDNYNMVIVPDNYDFKNWQSSFIGTGPFIKESYTPNVGATFVRNPDYWARKALPARTEFTVRCGTGRSSTRASIKSRNAERRLADQREAPAASSADRPVRIIDIRDFDKSHEFFETFSLLLRSYVMWQACSCPLDMTAGIVASAASAARPRRC